jgi:hypothetical protein
MIGRCKLGYEFFGLVLIVDGEELTPSAPPYRQTSELWGCDDVPHI